METIVLYVALSALAIFAFISDKRATALEERLNKIQRQWDELLPPDDFRSDGK